MKRTVDGGTFLDDDGAPEARLCGVGEVSRAYNEMSYADIAKTYNDINRIPEEAANRLGAAVAAMVGAEARIADLGGGAGRISVPVAARADTVAVDIELQMLKTSQALAAERGVVMRHAAATLLQLPFPDAAFDAVLIANVLHQVERWRDALAEAARVLKPGGPLIIARDILDENSCVGRLRRQSRAITSELAPEMRPTDAAGPALFQQIARMGGQPEPPVTACAWTETLSPREVLQRMANRTHNETWSLNDEQLAALMARIEPWAASHFENLDAREAVQWTFGLYPIKGLA